MALFSFKNISVIKKFGVLWDVTPTYSWWWFIALMMEAVRTSEMSVNFNMTTRRYIPEDNRLHTRRRENLKSHTVIVYFKCRLLSIFNDWNNFHKTYNQDFPCFKRQSPN